MAQSTCAPPRLSPLNGKPILLGFDGADMSSDAGLILLREIERKAGLAQRLAGGRGLPGHGGIKPDRQRTTALERFVIGRPVPGLVGGRIRAKESAAAMLAQVQGW